DVDGLKDADGNTISHLTIEQTKSLLSSGVAYGGMIPKLRACERAAVAGVTCRIVDGRSKRAVLSAIENTGHGSTVSTSGRDK
ncbi:MAG: acetylglutamate kinase, partial [Dehalococcoidia bacterium]|nr:acetylglutamate kinase [Dehalococcoidia bacterium]